VVDQAARESVLRRVELAVLCPEGAGEGQQAEAEGLQDSKVYFHGVVECAFYVECAFSVKCAFSILGKFTIIFLF
jgi:hypothetical protein